MPKIKAVPESINELSNKLSSVQKDSDEAASSIGKVKRNLDWQVASRPNIDDKLTDLQKQLRKQSELMNSYIRVLNIVNREFGESDGNLRNKAKGIIYTLNQMSASLKAFIGTVKSKMDYKKIGKLTGIMTVSTLFGASMLPKYSPDLLLDILKEKSRTGSKTDKDYSKMKLSELEKEWKRVSDKKIELLEKAVELEKKLKTLKEQMFKCLFPNGKVKGQEKFYEAMENKINTIIGDAMGLGSVDLSSKKPPPEEPNYWDLLPGNKDRKNKEFLIGEIQEENKIKDSLEDLLVRKTEAFDELKEEFDSIRSIAAPVRYKNSKTEIYWDKNDFPYYEKSGQRHNGTDIGHGGEAGEYGTGPGPDIITAVSGYVTDQGYHSSMGNYVIIKGIDGHRYRYMHLSKVDTENIVNNKFIKAGTVMGRMGNTGNSFGTHLHIDIKDPNKASYENPREMLVKKDKIGQNICSTCILGATCTFK